MRRGFLRIGALVMLALSIVGIGTLASVVHAAGPARGEVAGVVQYQGAGYAGATVYLFDGGTGWNAQTTSGAGGTFRFRKVPAGSYTVSAALAPPSLVCSGSAPVTVVSGQTAFVTVNVSCTVLPPSPPQGE